MNDVVRYGSSGNLERAVSGALNEVAVRQLVAERILKAKSQLGEYAVSEVVYLKAVESIASTNPDTALAVSAIINMTVAGITRTVGEFGASL